MNRLVLSILFVFSLSTASYGWSGGPFTSGNPQPTGYDGTYKASVVGNDIIGILVFGQNSVAGSNLVSQSQAINASGSGMVSLFVEGIAYTGRAIVMMEPAGRIVAGTFSGTRDLGLFSDDAGGVASLGVVSGTLRGLNGGFIGDIKNSGGTSVTFVGKGTVSIILETVSNDTTIIDGGSSVEGDNPDSVVTESTLSDPTVELREKIRVVGTRTSVIVPAFPSDLADEPLVLDGE